MLGDEDQQIRRVAVNKILAIRGELHNCQVDSDTSHFGKGFADESDGEPEVDTRASSVCRFWLPKINLQTKQYNKLADLNGQDVGEPPATQHLSTEAIKDILESPLTLCHPCYNQSVERHIKLITEASTTVASYKSCDGLIRQRIKSRRLMKKFETKRQFFT